MKIDSSPSGLHYPGRTQVLERREKDAGHDAAAAAQRPAGALTGSSTLLSPSLAQALWAIDSGEAADASTVPAGRVTDLYREFS